MLRAYQLVTFAALISVSLPVIATQTETEAIINENMVYIPAGSYKPLFKQDEALSEITIQPFYLDKYQVTNKEFVQFTNNYPKWQAENIKPIFSDQNYLKQLVNHSMEDIANQPVTNISWFAARAYCKSLDKRLPTLDEWEYVGQASKTKADGSKDPKHRQQILEWYARPTFLSLPDINQTEPNYWQVYGMHGVVWELVNDFNTSLVTGESRGDSQLEQDLFCGAGAASSVDPSDYAAFMRYALRSSYEASYTLSSLGFRCAQDSKLIAGGKF